jgi:hypothetical protein
MDINARNSSTTQTLNGWTMTFTLPAGSTITGNWNNTYTVSGSAVTVRSGQSWNSSVNPGATVNFGGFSISGNSANRPTSFTITPAICS